MLLAQCDTVSTVCAHVCFMQRHSPCASTQDLVLLVVHVCVLHRDTKAHMLHTAVAVAMKHCKQTTAKSSTCSRQPLDLAKD
jgi:hypothetical protein